MADFEVTFVNVGHGDATLIKIPGDHYVLVDVYRCPGEGIDLFKLLDDVLPDGDDGRKRLDVLAITHAHDDHIAGIGDLYDGYQVDELWLPQHAKKLQKVAGNYAVFERVVDEHPEDKKPIVKGSRSVWRTLGDGDEVSVRCFSPPGYVDPSEELDEEEMKKVVHENCVVLKFTYADYSVILTGDSNKPCWERVVGYYKGREDENGVEVLKALAVEARTVVRAAVAVTTGAAAMESRPARVSAAAAIPGDVHTTRVWASALTSLIRTQLAPAIARAHRACAAIRCICLPHADAQAREGSECCRKSGANEASPCDLQRRALHNGHRFPLTLLPLGCLEAARHVEAPARVPTVPRRAQGRRHR